MTLQDIKKTQRYGRTDARTDGQRENSIPPTNKVCGGMIIAILRKILTGTFRIQFKQMRYTAKPVQNGYSQKGRKLVFKTNYRLMQVTSIAKCSKGSILQYFRPSLSHHLSLRSLFCLFSSGHFSVNYTGFTVIHKKFGLPLFDAAYA